MRFPFVPRCFSVRVVLCAALMIAATPFTIASLEIDPLYAFRETHEAFPVTTAFAVAPPVVRYARTAALLDVTTGTVLYERGGDQLWPPASLTKLVTIYTALASWERGGFSLDDPLEVDPSAYWYAVPAGSSLMFLGPDQRVTGRDLLRGLAIASGNDAAVEVALRVHGSVDGFVEAMNAVVTQLGYRGFSFADPAGLSAANRISAVGFSRFSAHLLSRWPWLSEELFLLPEYVYPQAEHYGGRLRGDSIRRPNGNGLVYSYDGVRGLKTGFIEESGYNLSAAATRGDRTLVAVVLGVQSTTHEEGARRREYDARALLDWGFNRYTGAYRRLPAMEPIRVWKGRERRVVPVVSGSTAPFVIPVDRATDVRGEVQIASSVEAPVAAGTRVGTVRYLLNDVVLDEMPITIDAPIEAGGVLRRFFDTIASWFAALFGGDSAPVAA